jgi:Protein of unknown function (DUF3455)
MSIYTNEMLAKMREKDIEREMRQNALVQEAKATTKTSPKTEKRFGLLIALLALLSLILSLFFVQSAKAQSITALTPPVVPNNLNAPAGEIPVAKISAKGVQIYRCTVSATDATKYEWTLKAPEAELFDEQGKYFGKHYAGPTWEATDGSKVVGELKERANAPDGKGIAWLLLKAKETTTGKGLLSNITSIQRVDTMGGFAPPADTCDQTRKDNHEARVDYTTIYYFYRSADAVNPIPVSAPASGQGGLQNEQIFSNFSLIIALGAVMLVSLGGLVVLRIYRHQNKSI